MSQPTAPATIAPFAEPGPGTVSARRFAGMRCLVTGAGGGIGRAVALRLAAEGAEVTAADLDPVAAAATAQAAQSLRDGGSVRPVLLDVRDADSVEAVAARFADVPLDVLVNNAGIEILGDIVETTPDVWDEIMAVNLRGPYLVSRALMPALRRSAAARGEATIVHNASLMGLVSSARLAAYCASKAGLVSLTRSMALDLAKERIRVNCVCPGIIHTSMLERRFDLTDNRDQAYADTLRRPPIQYLGRPEDVAAAVTYLAAPESRFVTGTALTIDGGVGAA
jgi:NAD(P)-dependent dehydrogenase (short-subunit alcohol dehydrogenase family)